MKIKLEKLRNEPISISEELEASSWGLDSDDVKFIDNIHIDCTFSKVYKEILVDVKIVTKRKITCSRCLNRAQRIVEQNFKKSYNSESLSEELDINNDIREEILLNFPMKVLCRDDCKGICPDCGKNLNESSCNCVEKKKKTIKIDI